jgi:hypothetical protein
MRGALLMRRFTALARYFTLSGFIHGSKAALAIAATASATAASVLIRNHDVPPV